MARVVAGWFLISCQGIRVIFSLYDALRYRVFKFYGARRHSLKSKGGL